MKMKTLAVLLLAILWGVASWWWYTCRIKGFCSTANQQAAGELSPAAANAAPPAATKAPHDGGDITDSDNDGLPNTLENKLGLDPYVSDSDRDGVRDELEIGNNTDTPLDTDDDGTINALDEDDDGDGDPTANESPDPNGDGDPKDARDADGDGIPDYLDKDSGWASRDDDGDGVSNAEEKELGTNPALTDTDGDGVPDSIELVDAQDTDGDQVIDALDTDDDGDGVMTALENPDPNGDGNIADAADHNGNGVPDYLDADTSGESLAAPGPDTLPGDQDMATGNAAATTATTAPVVEAVAVGNADNAAPGTTSSAAPNATGSAVTTTDTASANGLAMADIAPPAPAGAEATEAATQPASTEPPAATPSTTGANSPSPIMPAPSDAATPPEPADKLAGAAVAEATQPLAPTEPTNGKSMATGQPNGAQQATPANNQDQKDQGGEGSKADADDKAKDKNRLTADTGGRQADSKTIRPAKLYFPFKSAEPELAESAADYFDEVIAYLKANRDAKIVLTGHTDSVGKPESNHALGLQRAKEIRDLLVKRGARRKQVDVDSKGEEEPLTSNRTDTGREKNRRVELNLAE